MERLSTRFTPLKAKRRNARIGRVGTGWREHGIGDCEREGDKERAVGEREESVLDDDDDDGVAIGANQCGDVARLTSLSILINSCVSSSSSTAKLAAAWRRVWRGGGEMVVHFGDEDEEVGELPLPLLLRLADKTGAASNVSRRLEVGVEDRLLLLDEAGEWLLLFPLCLGLPLLLLLRLLPLFGLVLVLRLRRTDRLLPDPL